MLFCVSTRAGMNRIQMARSWTLLWKVVECAPQKSECNNIWDLCGHRMKITKLPSCLFKWQQARLHTHSNTLLHHSLCYAAGCFQLSSLGCKLNISCKINSVAFNHWMLQAKTKSRTQQFVISCLLKTVVL